MHERADDIYWFQQSGRDFLRLVRTNPKVSERIWIESEEGRRMEIGETAQDSISDFRFTPDDRFTVLVGDNDRERLSRSFRRISAPPLEFRKGIVEVPALNGATVDIDFFRWSGRSLEFAHRIENATMVDLNDLRWNAVPWLTWFPHYALSTIRGNDGRSGVTTALLIRHQVPVVHIVFESVADPSGGHALVRIVAVGSSEPVTVALSMYSTDESTTPERSWTLDVPPNGNDRWTFKDVMHGCEFRATVNQNWVIPCCWTQPRRRLDSGTTRARWEKVPGNRWKYIQSTD